MKHILTLAALALLSVALPAQQYDAAGNDLSTLGGPIGSAPGGVLQTLAGPAAPSSDIAHDGQYLLVCSFYDGAPTIYHVNDTTGATAATTTIGTSGDYGLAWDDKRELFVTADPGVDVLQGWTRSGALAFNYSYPSTGFVGVAWDCRRDVYWVIDWTTNTVSAINPANGAMGASYSTALIGCTRGAGLGYDANTDTLYMGGRDQSAVFGMSAATGALACSFAAQDGGNNPQGVAMSPRGGVWHSSWNSAALNELEGCKPTHPALRFGPNFPVAGSGITLTMSGLVSGERGIFVYSRSGCGPTPSPIGDMLLSNPRFVLAIVPSSGAGVATLGGTLPGGLSGATLYFHGGGLSGSGRCNNAIINP